MRRPSPCGGLAPSSPPTSNGSNTDPNGARATREVPRDEVIRVLEDAAVDKTGAAAVDVVAMAATAEVRRSSTVESTTTNIEVVDKPR